VLDLLHLQGVAHLDVQQNLDVAHLDVAHLGELHPVDVVVDVELRHQLKMDCYLDVVGVELSHQLKMDYYPDVEQRVLQEQVALEQSLHPLR
jgi:hypothetical protein